MTASPLGAADLAALSIFPLPNATLFPGALLPLHVFEPRYRDMVRDALAGTKVLAVARLKPGFEDDYAGRPPVFEVCGAGRIVEHVAHDDGRYDILLEGRARVRIVLELPAATTYRVVRAERFDDTAADPGLCAALEAKIRELWAALAPALPESLRDMEGLARGAGNAGEFADRLGAAMGGDIELAQTLLAERDPGERLRLIVERLQTLLDARARAPHSDRKRWN
jgi:hypothetical protein